MSDHDLVREWKFLQSVAPVGTDLEQNGEHVIALIRFTLQYIERLTTLAELGVRRAAN